MKPTIHGLAFGLFSLSLLAGSAAALATDHDGNAASVKSAPTPAASAKDDQVRKMASQEISKRRSSLVKEAVAANDEIIHSISLLQNKDTQGAFKALAKADGQLSVLLARDPQLKLAAIDVRASITDLVTSPKLIKKAVSAAESALDHRHIQLARADLSPLVSEMHISTDYLPLESYPDAIKKASKEIQQSKIKEAEDTLAEAMGSIVTVEKVIPLPPVQAEGDVLAAEKLLNKDKVKNKGQVISLLKSADNHLAIANALGYGKYRAIRDEIASIDSKVKAGTETPGLFDRIKHFFHDIDHGKNA